MREIKFRAWDDENKKYLYVGEFIIFYEEDNGFHSGMTNKNGDWKSFTIEQYTGLKDSTGKEIYEGDKYKTFIAIVKNGKQSRKYIEKIISSDNYYYDCTILNNIIEYGLPVTITGNIHE